MHDESDFNCGLPESFFLSILAELHYMPVSTSLKKVKTWEYLYKVNNTKQDRT